MNKVTDLSDVTGDHLGCWIDGSNMSATEFDIQLVETGIHFGFEIDIRDWNELKNQLWDKDKAWHNGFMSATTTVKAMLNG